MFRANLTKTRALCKDVDACAKVYHVMQVRNGLPIVRGPFQHPWAGSQGTCRLDKIRQFGTKQFLTIGQVSSNTLFVYFIVTMEAREEGRGSADGSHTQ